MSFLLLLFLFLLLIAIISKKRDYFELKIIHRKGDDGNLGCMRVIKFFHGRCNQCSNANDEEFSTTFIINYESSLNKRIFTLFNKSRIIWNNLKVIFYIICSFLKIKMTSYTRIFETEEFWIYTWLLLIRVMPNHDDYCRAVTILLFGFIRYWSWRYIRMLQ